MMLALSTSLIAVSPALAQDDTGPDLPGKVPATADGAVAPGAGPQTADSDAQTEQAGGLAEIVVTANRRVENMQKVPVAVSQVSAELADTLQIDDPQEITQLVPGFTFQRQASGATPFVRGIGSTSSFVGNEPAVAILVDDIYVSNGNAAIFEFNNIDAVEVLKGPQGTLFGRNATGGVIHVKTKDPSFDPTMNVEVGYGNYDTVTAKGYVSAGLSDAIAFNLSAFRVDQGKGWGRNVIDGSEVFKSNSWGVRGKLLIKLGENTDILLGGSFSNRRSDQGIAERVVPGYFGFGGTSPEVAGAGFYDSANSSIRDFYDTDFWQANGKLTHDFGSVSLVSITAYNRTKTFFSFDLDAAAPDILNATVDNNAKTFTQEVQLLSNGDESFDWILGGFFLSDTSVFDLVASGLGVTSRFGPGATQAQFSRQKTTSYAIFGQANYELTPEFSLTAGLRYTSDKRAESDGGSAIITGTGATLIAAGPFASSKTFRKLTWRLAADYQVTPDVMIYASYNRGFKSGVYNLPGYSPASNAPLPPVQPEVLDAYAVGFKSELFDRLLRLNVEAFYYDYKNIQFQNNVPPPNAGTILTNAGAAEIRGIEGELTLAPARGFSIIANASYLDGNYTEFPNAPTFFPLRPNAPIPIPAGCAFTAYPTGAPGAPAAQQACNQRGSRTVNTPPFSAAVTALYELTTDIGSFDLSGSWTHGGNYYSEADNLNFVRQPSYDLFNAAIRWRDPSDKISLRVWGNNLTKAKYYSYVANGGTSGPKYSPAAPQTYGVTLGFQF
jgi:iron complex outermembrane receptor protein